MCAALCTGVMRRECTAQSAALVLGLVLFSVALLGTAGPADVSDSPPASSLAGLPDFLPQAPEDLLSSTLFGGRDTDQARAIVVDGSGDVFVGGYTFSADLYTTPGAFGTTFNGGRSDAFAARFSADGALVFATFLGGSGNESVTAIAITPSGDVVVAGYTDSPDFPTTPDALYPESRGLGDAFLAILSPDGDILRYATYFGGSGTDSISSIDVGSALYVAGSTQSNDLPVTPNALGPAFGGGSDAFFAAFGLDDRTLLATSYLGGSDWDGGADIVADASGSSVYIAGSTSSADFPATSDAFDGTLNPPADAFVAKLSVDGTALEYATFLGGSHTDTATAIAECSAGTICIVGYTGSQDFPVSEGAFDNTANGGFDMFFARLPLGGPGPYYGTLLGGSTFDIVSDIALGPPGTILATGRTASSDFPVTDNAYDPTWYGRQSGFVVMLSEDASSLLYSTFFGGAGQSRAAGLSSEPGSVYVVGSTKAEDFPTTAGAHQRTLAGTYDAFVARLAIEAGAVPPRIQISLLTPYPYVPFPPGVSIVFEISGEDLARVEYSLDGSPPVPIQSPYTFDTASWTDGTHLLRIDLWNDTSVAISKTYPMRVASGADWPLDTVNVTVVLIGFEVPPNDLASRLTSEYHESVRLRRDALSRVDLPLRFEFNVISADAAYHASLVDHVRTHAEFTDGLQARLNITALIDQRDNGTPRDIFDALVGRQIRTEWVEAYIDQFPPAAVAPGFTFYLMNLSALDDPAAGIDHWFVEDNQDPDTGRNEDWWRLEWDNDPNTPMGYPLNAWGGPGRRVYVDPTAYQWSLDWAHVWWQAGSGPAPNGTQYEDTASEARADYLAGLVNDLIEGLATDLPSGPPHEPRVLLKNLVLSGSNEYRLDELHWAVSDVVLRAYLRRVLPFKSIEVETSWGLVDDYPDLKRVVEENTTYMGERGLISGVALWNYVNDHHELFVQDDPDTFEIVGVSLLYDNRSLGFGGREFTALGGSGTTLLILDTDRLFYGDGSRQKGITSILLHETGHSFSFGHQIGPNNRADFIQGGMGYFRMEPTWGQFWEDNLYRVYARGTLERVLGLVNLREPLPLEPEFGIFYNHMRDAELLAALQNILSIEAMLTDTVPPVALAGEDMTVVEDVEVPLDASASTDNFRIVRYRWDFGDGTLVTSSEPTMEKVWTKPDTFTVTLTVYDAAGNVATDTLVATVLDITPPTVSILAPSSDALLTTNEVEVTWTASDEGGGVARIEVSLDDGPPIVPTPGVSSYTFAGVADGHHTVALAAIDEAGNLASISLSFRVETAPAFVTPFVVGSSIAAAVAVGLTAGFLIYRRFRRRRASVETPPPPPG